MRGDEALFSPGKAADADGNDAIAVMIVQK